MLDDPLPALKRQLAEEIVRISRQTNFHVAAPALGIDEARLSDLRRGRVDRFSVDRLIRILATVDRRVDLRIVPVAGERVSWFTIIRQRRVWRLANVMDPTNPRRKRRPRW
jgi:predicted XRE-type DNA-binding protein